MIAERTRDTVEQRRSSPLGLCRVRERLLIATPWRSAREPLAERRL